MESTIDEAVHAQLSNPIHIWAAIKQAEETILYCTRCGKRPDQVTIYIASSGDTQCLPCKGFIG